MALAVDGCDRWCRQLLEVALVLRGPTSASAIAALVRTAGGDTATVEQVEAGVERLADRLLLFLDGEGRIWVNPGLVSLLTRPCGLGPPAADLLSALSVSVLRRMVEAIGVEAAGRSKADLAAAVVAVLSDPAAVRRLLDAAPPESLRLLRQARSGQVDLPYTAWSRPTTTSGAAGPHAWLLARGLLIDPRQSYGYGLAEVPREVGLALRGGVAIPAGAPEPPPVASVAAGDPAELDRRAAARAGTTVRSVTRLLGLLEATPAATLKGGGVGSREVGRLAKALEVSTEEAFVLLEMAAEAGLVARASYQPVVPTDAADGWLDGSPGDRWLALARGWLDAPGIPSIAGRKAPTGKVAPGLVRVNGVDGRRLRHETLDLLASAAPGQRVAGDLVGAVGWSLPAVVQGLEDVVGDLVDWTVAEAAALGLASDGALTSVGRLLHAGDEAVAELASSLLVDAPAEVILQADLTAVVDAAAPQGLLDELRLLADTESAGSAVVLRFSAGSVRRALDAGRDAEQILAFLSEHAARGVPQPLEYLVTDTARRWGSMRVGGVRSYVRSEDAVLLEEAIRHRRLAKVGLRLLAPTVATSEAEPAVVLTALRDAGFLPVEEDASGATLRAQPRRERAAASVPRPGRGGGPTAGPVDVETVAKALLAAAEPDPGSEIATLFEARSADDGFDVGADPQPDHVRIAYGLDDDLDDDLDPVVLFDTLVDLLDTAAIVELRLVDAHTGRERAVTGLVVDVDLRVGLVTVEREPDGSLVTVDPDDVWGIRVLGSARGRP